MAKEAEPILRYLKVGNGKWQPSCKEHYLDSFAKLSEGAEEPGEATSFICGDTTGVMGTSVELRRLGFPELTARLPILT